MKKSQSGFSLLELLVVIAIMAALASAVALGVRSGLRNAHAARCQMHMQQLHRAMLNHLADRGYYPPARTYLCIDKLNNNTKKNFRFQRGWVNWIGGEDNKYGKPDDSKDLGKYNYVGCGSISGTKAADIQKSIAWGALFKYVGNDYSTYFCKEFNGGKSKRAKRTYALNSWFGGSGDFYRYNLAGTQTLLSIDSTRLAMFVELADAPSKKQGDYAGASDISPKPTIKEDSSWDWADGERIGAWHRKNGKMYGHVIFMDGHIESLSADDCKNSEVIKNLGKGLR